VSAAAIVADFHRAIEALAEVGETRTAEALRRWLAGEDFEAAAGLIPGWRAHLRLTARDRALTALAATHAGMSDNALAEWIVEGLQRVGAVGVRPDGADGYLVDLARAGCTLSKRQLRRLIAEVGHQSC
jgi:hypothetical protein